MLDQIGFGVHVLDGGYQAFRRAVVAELETLPATLQLRVVCGRTGSGKSRLLQALAAAGAQVLDLEALACHRGSVLGPLPGVPQPSQKAFETLLWRACAASTPRARCSSKARAAPSAGCACPSALLERLRAAPVLHIEMPLAARVALLLEDYAHFVHDAGAFCERLAALRELRGAATVERWQAQARAGDFATVVHELLDQHYDPIYLRSMQRNFAGFAAAQVLPLDDGTPATLAGAARALVAAP